MQYNNFKEIQECSIPDGGAIFEALGIKDDPDNPGRKMRCDEYLSPTTTIYHNKKSEAVAAIISVSPDGNPAFVPVIKFGRDSYWKIFLKAGNPEHEAIYKRLKFSDENIDRIGRDTSARAIYREYNPEKEAKFQVEIEKEIAKAISLANGLEGDQIKQFGIAANMADKSTAEIELYAFSVAKSNPSLFMEIYNKLIKLNQSKDHKDVIKRAFDEGKLVKVKEDKSITYNGDVVATYDTPNPSFEAVGKEIEAKHPKIYESLK